MIIYVIAFLSPLFYALSVLIDRFLSVDIFKKTTTICFYSCLTNALFVPLLFVFGMPTLPDLNCFIAYVILAFIDVAYLCPYYIALKKTDASVVAAMFALGKAFVPILAFFVLGDVLTPVQYFGFFIVVFAAVALNMEKRFSLKLNSAFYLMLLSSFMRALYIVLAKYALNSDELWINTIVYPCVISSIMVLSFLLIKNFRSDIKQHWRPYIKKFHFFVLNEFVCFLALLSVVYALSKLSPIISSAIGETQPLFLLLLVWLARPFCKIQEANVPMLKKLVCFLLTILGIMLIS